MTYGVWGPLLLALLLPALQPLVAAAPPRAAALSLVALGGTALLGGTGSLVLVALAPFLVERGGADPQPGWAGRAAALGAVLLVAVVVVAVARQLAVLHAVDRLLGGTGARPRGDVPTVVVPGRTDALAVAGLRRGRVELGGSLLAALTPSERRAVTAHERAHVAHRHAWLRAAAHVLAVGHPALRGLPDRVEAACERWADEDAAAHVGDRAVVARALAHAALLPPSAVPAAGHGSGLGGGATVRRVEALLAPPPARRPVVAAGVAVAAALVVACLLNGAVELAALTV